MTIVGIVRFVHYEGSKFFFPQITQIMIITKCDVRIDTRRIGKWQKDHPMYNPKQVPVCMSWNLEDYISKGKGSLVRHFQNLRCCHKAEGPVEGTPHSG
jgi:hypothetical protein